MKITPLLLCVLFTASAVHAELTEEQRAIPLEVDAPNAQLAKIILIAGVPSNKPGQHEYFAGCALMFNWLKQQPGVWPVLVANGWPQDEKIFAGAKAIVVYADGGPKLPMLEPSRLERIRASMNQGAGFVLLHQTVDIPEAQAPVIQDWLGGVWTKDIGCRGHWDMSFETSVKHPILQGVQPFSAPLDGWLFNLHFAAQGVTPILTGTVPATARSTADAKAYPDRAETIAWIYERPGGGRSFAFTGCDLHRSWQIESQRRMVTNAILWTANLDVPQSGATAALEPGALAKNLDAK